MSFSYIGRKLQVQLFVTLWTITHQALLSMGFSRQEYWSRLPCPSPGDLPDPGLEPVPHVLDWQAGSLPLVSTYVKVKLKIPQLCPTLCDPMDCTVHGILQARILEWVAFPFPFSRGSSQPRDRTQVSHIAGRFFTSWATREAQKTRRGQSSQVAVQFLRQDCCLSSRCLWYLLATELIWWLWEFSIHWFKQIVSTYYVLTMILLWCWSWNSNTLATWCEELTTGKDPDAGKDWRQEEKGTTDRGWNGWMASLTQWMWVWASSGSWWWTGKPGMLQSTGSQRVWASELNWSSGNMCKMKVPNFS